MKKMIWHGIYYGKRGLLWGIYLIFAAYVIHLVSTADQVGVKVLFTLIGGVALGIVLLFEHLKHIYDKMIYALTVDCDTHEAEHWRQKLQRQDIFKGFKGSLLIFDALLFLDNGHYEDCLEHLMQHEAFFRSTFDYLFIYYHTQLHCYYFLQEAQQAEHILSAILKLKSIKTKRISALYSWHEIDGIKFYLQGRNAKSLTSFEQVDITRLNNREQAYLFYMMGCSHLKAGNTAKGNQLLHQARATGNTLHIKTV